MTILFQGILLIFVIIICFFNIKVSLTLLIFSMLLSPEIAVGSTSSRDVTLRAEDLLLLFMTFGWLCRMAIIKDISFTEKNPLNKPIFLYIFLCVISTSFGALRGDVNILSGFFFTLKIIEYFVLFYIVINYAKSMSDINYLLNIIFLVCFIVTLYGIFMILTGGDVAAPFEGSEGEKNTLTGYLSLIGVIAGGILITTNSKAEKLFLSILITAIVFVLVFSSSRSGWIASSVGIIVLFFQAKKKNIFILLFCIFILAAPFIIPEEMAERINYTFQQDYHPGMHMEFFGIRLDTSTSARLFMIRLVFQKITKHLFLGYGITGFSFIDGHYIRILIELGILGFIAFIWLLARIHNVISEVKNKSQDSRIKGTAIGLYAGFWALIFHAFSANTFIIVRISEPFWCFVALMIIAQSHLNKKPENIELIEK
ncbi:MAG: O-antigen ligase family protein [Chitinispirillia bacterium]